MCLHNLCNTYLFTATISILSDNLPTSTTLFPYSFFIISQLHFPCTPWQIILNLAPIWPCFPFTRRSAHTIDLPLFCPSYQPARSLFQSWVLDLVSPCHSWVWNKTKITKYRIISSLEMKVAQRKNLLNGPNPTVYLIQSWCLNQPFIYSESWVNIPPQTQSSEGHCRSSHNLVEIL